MAFTEDLKQFFDPRDHAVAARVTQGNLTRDINVIFETPSEEIALFQGAEASAALPFIRCRASDLAGFAREATVRIADKTYKLKTITFDGTGLAVAQLR